MIRIAINDRHAGKDPPGLSPEAKEQWFGWYNGRFTNREMSVEELIDEIRQGHGYTTWHNRYRKGANFIMAQHTGLDLDHLPAGTTLHDVAAQPFISDLAAFIHTTASHTPEAPRMRVVYILDRPITDAGKYTDLAEALLWRFDEADPKCKDACRLFFGAEDCDVLEMGNVLTLEDAAHHFVYPWRHWKEEQERQAEERARSTVTVAAGDVSAERLTEKKDFLLGKIRSAPEGEKYYTLRDISRTFGGYVAGGYYSELDARSWLRAAIETRRDTVKSMNHAYATIDEGLAYGRLDPLEFTVTEGEKAPAGELASRPKSEPAEEGDPFEALVRELPASDPVWAWAVEQYDRHQKEKAAA